jgi:nucleoid DNA-binding protein
MQKLDIVKRIHQEAGISEEQAARVLEWFLKLLKDTLQTGEPIMIQGFGKFTVRQKRSRTGRNPRTGETIKIPARRVVSFHASPLLKTELYPVHAEQQEAVERTEELTA